jgi:hypothetical protein
MSEGNIRKCAVIGNGKSLRGFDFTKIECDTVGLTLAYRHWYNIDWFPTYYVNVDHVVLHHNHKDIKKLIEEKRCKGYLLSKSILKDIPELSKNDSVIFLEDLQKQRGNPFRYLVDWCSGSVAFLFAVILGYNDINAMGLDCNYVEFLPETEQLPDGTLRITKTPTENPNYFIDDYQREGDVYNKPNLERVHNPSWEHVVFILTGYVHMNRIMMNVFAWTTDEVVGLSKFFTKKHINDFIKVQEEEKEKRESKMDDIIEEIKENDKEDPVEEQIVEIEDGNLKF